MKKVRTKDATSLKYTGALKKKKKKKKKLFISSFLPSFVVFFNVECSRMQARIIKLGNNQSISNWQNQIFGREHLIDELFVYLLIEFIPRKLRTGSVIANLIVCILQ